MNTFKIVVGDWEQLGHRRYSFVNFQTNLTAQEVREAYRAGVRAAGVGLHTPEDGESHAVILQEDNDSRVFPDAVRKLTAVGVDVKKAGALDEEWNGEATLDFRSHPDGVATLFLELAKVARPDMQYELVDDVVECLNGYYREGFNVGVGYGVLH